MNRKTQALLHLQAQRRSAGECLRSLEAEYPEQVLALHTIAWRCGFNFDDARGEVDRWSREQVYFADDAGHLIPVMQPMIRQSFDAWSYLTRANERYFMFEEEADSSPRTFPKLFDWPSELTLRQPEPPRGVPPEELARWWEQNEGALFVSSSWTPQTDAAADEVTCWREGMKSALKRLENECYKLARQFGSNKQARELLGPPDGTPHRRYTQRDARIFVLHQTGGLSHRAIYRRLKPQYPELKEEKTIRSVIQQMRALLGIKNRQLQGRPSEES